MLSFILAAILCIPTIIESTESWSYQNPKLWARKNRYCGGRSQSPINIRFNRSSYNAHLKPISLEERDPTVPDEVFNSGFTAQLNLNGRYVLKNVVPGGEDYIAEQIHFHWGHSNDNVNGSEHLYEGQSYPIEMHLVAYSSWYSNILDAMHNTRALAVIGVFFEISDEPNPLLQPLVNALKHIRGQDSRFTLNNSIDVKTLIGENRLRRYYRYDGSLTTPPCFESVVWTVLLEPLKLSFRQLHGFRYLHDKHANLIQDTYRPIQKLGTRKLFRNFHVEDIQERRQQLRRMEMIDNSGQNVKSYMKFISILLSFFIFIIY
ncbi:unnamed protein product [Adineta ricciae]|uniref:carbonic anhydrase n=1 Tax=Adineta ricciae TaxID=249248 RepID=A0A814T8Q4_ADIRI|nr:unnamed protein product [Adineta ricciae]